jgi:hypothetical protein
MTHSENGSLLVHAQFSSLINNFYGKFEIEVEVPEISR